MQVFVRRPYFHPPDMWIRLLNFSYNLIAYFIEPTSVPEQESICPFIDKRCYGIYYLLPYPFRLFNFPMSDKCYYHRTVFPYVGMPAYYYNPMNRKNQAIMQANLLIFTVRKP